MVIKATKPAMTNVNKMTYIVNWRGKTKKVQILVKRHHNQYMPEIKSRIYAWSY